MAHFRSLNDYFRSRYSFRVQKITVSYPFRCPHGACSYCSGGSTPVMNDINMPVAEQVRRGIANSRKRYGKGTKFFVYFQSYTNTNAPVEELKRIYGEALGQDGVIGISVGTRPDSVTPEVLGLLDSYNADGLESWIEIGLQSASDATLKRVNRGHDVAAFVRAAEMIKRTGVRPVAHMIAGFPWETGEDMLASARLIADNGFFGIKVHPLHILEGTKLAEEYRKGGLKLLDLEQYVKVLCDIIDILPPETVLMRFTAEADQKKLIAPGYCAHGYKDIIRRMVEEEMGKRAAAKSQKS